MAYNKNMHKIWSGSISFGFVNIPVHLYPATVPVALSFDLLHKKDLSPVKYQRVSGKTREEVPWEDIVKGYKYKDKGYVVLTEEDFKRANVKKTQTIEILSFAHNEEIDPIYFEKPYIVEPEKGSEKIYALLRDALKESQKVGIARFVLSSREHVGIVEPKGDILFVTQMRYENEFRKIEGLSIPKKQSITDKEMKMALQFIKQLSEPFKPEKYKDTYMEELKKIIEKKAAGKKITAVEEKSPEPTKVDDLMEKLKASLDHAQKGHYAH